MGKRKKIQKRQPMLTRVRHAHARNMQDNNGQERSYGFQLVGAFFCDAFYYIWKILKWILLIGVVCTAVLAVALFVRYGDKYKTFTSEADQVVEDSQASDFRMDEITYIYAAFGEQIAQLNSGGGKSSYLRFDQIPDDAVNAFIAIEDRSYWRNIGIDVKGILRVLRDFITSNGEDRAGASTITQQLARTIYLTRERSIERKIKEMMIAIRLTRKYTKEDIMEYYINTACFGNGIYGLQAASRAYFSKDASELSLSETAYLCAIPNRPEYYNPYKHPQRAIDRRNKILKDMAGEGYISKKAYKRAAAEEITIVKEQGEFYNYETTYAVHCAVEYMMKLHGFAFRYEFTDREDYAAYQESYESAYNLEKANLYSRGYRITTSLDMDAQQAMQQALDQNLAFATELDPQTEIYKLQGAVTAIDNSTGKVVAVVGGRSQENLDNIYSLNRAYQSYRQPGSTIKPLAVYAPALMDGYTADTTVYDIDVTKAKEPGVDVSSLTGKAMSLRYAVEQSKNGVAYSVFNDIGPSYGLSFLARMKFDRIVPEDYTLSAALGGLTYGVTTVQMASGYSTLANQGDYREPTCITSIKNADGRELYRQEEAVTVYSPQVSAGMLDILKGVLTTGTAKSMGWYQNTQLAAAGKTGTTNGSKDGWFCGVTPYYTVAVWIGYDTPQTLESLYGGTYPASVWKDAMEYLTEGLSQIDFN